MKTIKQTYHIKAPVEKVWQALVDPKIIDEWGGGPAEMNEKANSSFSLWDGEIHGKNIEVVKNKKLVQDWYSGNWSKPSTVTFALFSEKDGARVDLLHVNVPEEDAEDIEEGWDTFYLGEIKSYLEKKPL